METKPLIYLATPYSHPDPLVMEQRFQMACRIASRLMEKNIVVYSPIAHCHPIAQIAKLPTDWDYWKRFDKTMIHLSAAVVVVMAPGWGESKGVKAEIILATQLKKQLFFINEEESDESEGLKQIQIFAETRGLVQHSLYSDLADDLR